MKFRRTLMCAIVLSTSLTTPLALAQTAQIHHEVSLGISDIKDADDKFLGVGYRYYFDTVNMATQPWAISPYLQRANNASVNYFAIDDLNSINIDGEWFYSDTLIVRGRYGRISDERNLSDVTQQRVGISLSTFANDHWEYGAGIDLFDIEEAFYAYDDPTTRYKADDNELSFSLFARYTSFGGTAKSFTPGWDIAMKGTHFDDEFSIEIDADYYLKPNWSVGVAALYENHDGYSSENLIELGTNYWFNPYSSLRFGLGYDTDDGDLGSITLLGTFRF